MLQRIKRIDPWLVVSFLLGLVVVLVFALLRPQQTPQPPHLLLNLDVRDGVTGERLPSSVVHLVYSPLVNEVDELVLGDGRVCRPQDCSAVMGTTGEGHAFYVVVTATGYEMWAQEVQFVDPKAQETVADLEVFLMPIEEAG